MSGISTVVIGQAENTQSKTSTPWVVTLLHEHFHQLQTARPDYYAAVNTLNLSGGDQTGMWMLNYPFPYAQPTVEQAYAQLTQHLLAALNAPNAKLRSRYAAAYRKAKAAMQRTVSASDYRYFGFQVWQEGVARYTEYRVALAAADGYQPTAAFRALPDYRPYAEHATALKTAGLRELAAGPLSRQQRVAFYPLGLAEALLLDKVSPDWRRRYLAERFGTDGYFKP